MATTTTLMLDERGRTSLAKITKHRLFTVTVQEGGRIILEPAVVVSAQSIYDGDAGVRAEVAAGEAGSAVVRSRPTREGAAAPEQRSGGAPALSPGSEKVTS